MRNRRQTGRPGGGGRAAEAVLGSRGRVIEIRDLVKVYTHGRVEVRALDGVDLLVDAGDFVASWDRRDRGSRRDETSGASTVPHRERTSSTTSTCLTGPRRSRGHPQCEIGFVCSKLQPSGADLCARRTSNCRCSTVSWAGHAPSAGRRRRRALQRVGLAGREGHYPSQLSGGQQQRVAIARALVTNPAILLADEPTGNLDSRTSEEIMGIFQQLNDSEKTVVLITHEPDIARHAKRVVHVRDGRIRRIADPAVSDRVCHSEPRRRRGIPAQVLRGDSSPSPRLGMTASRTNHEELRSTSGSITLVG